MTPARAALAPADKSISSINIMNVIPIAATPDMEIWRNKFTKLSTVKKSCDTMETRVIISISRIYRL